MAIRLYSDQNVAYSDSIITYGGGLAFKFFDVISASDKSRVGYRYNINLHDVISAVDSIVTNPFYNYFNPLTESHTPGITAVLSTSYDNTNQNNLTSNYGQPVTPENGPWQSSTILDDSSADLDNPNNKITAAINGTLDWQQEMKNMAANINGIPNIPEAPVTDIRNEALNTETQRILSQGNSEEFNREDSFSIGTVTLNIPPVQISISEEKNNFRYRALRASADVVTTSGRSTLRIDLDVVFNGVDDINNKLRPLLAQFKCTPFLPIENEYVRSVVEPDSSTLNNSDDEDNEGQDSNDQSDINQINSLSSNKQASINNLLSQVQSLQSMGALSSNQANEASTLVNQWYGSGSSAALGPVGRYCSTSNVDGSITLNFKDYVSSLISAGPQMPADQLGPLTTVMNNLSSISNNIDTYTNAQTKLVGNNINQRYVNKKIVGVLSQFTVSTMPGYPQALSARISMYVFNYEPYSYDFSFVKGYDPASYTPDITQCDLFISWYSNRFLGASSPGALGTYESDNSLYFTYLESLSYDDLIANSTPNVTPKNLSLDKNTFVTGMSVTMRNIIKFLPILSGSRPTCQYMGAYNSSVQINLNSTSKKKVGELRKMLDTMSKIARKSNRVGRYYLFQVANYLTSLCGFRYFIVDGFSVDTVQGSPGLYSITMDLSEAKIGQERLEQLDRVLTTDYSSVLNAATYIINQARAYILDTSPTHSTTAAYAGYYQMLFGDTGVPGNDPTNQELAKCIKGVVNGQITGQYPQLWDVAVMTSEINKIKGGGNLGYNGASTVNSMAVAAQQIANMNGYDTNAYANQATDNLNTYITNFITLFNGGAGKYPDGTPMNWATESNFASYCLANGDFEEISEMLNPQSVGAPDLQNYVTTQAMASKGSNPTNLVDPTCYPDLALPLYKDLGTNGNKFKLTYGELGLVSNDPTMKTWPAQTDYVAIEPDAFYRKLSVQKLTDNVGTPGMNTGLNNFLSISQNCQLSADSPVDPSVFMDKIYKAMSLDNDSYGVPVNKSNEIIAKAMGNVFNPGKSKDFPSAKVFNFSSNTSNSNTDMIDGKPCQVTQVLDASTVLVNSPSGKTYAVRFVDYLPAPDGMSGQASSDAINQYFAGAGNTPSISTVSPNTKIATSVLNGQTIVPKILNMGTVYQYGYNILQASATIGGQNVATLMTNAGMQMDSTTDPTQADANNNSTNSIPGQASQQELVNAFGEYAFSTYENTKNAVIRRLKLLNPYYVPSSSTVVGNNETEAIGVGIQGQKGTDTINNRYIYPSWLTPGTPRDQLNVNNNYNRFDRYSKDHISEIATRIRYQSKDDMLRMVRAFPTFKFYFVEDNRMEFVPLPSFFKTEFKFIDELYSYNAIISIDINRNRKEASDTAVVRILNTKGILDRSRFGLHDPGSNQTQQSFYNTEDLNTKNTVNQSQTIDEFILKPGTRIRIKMGYCSDPTFLENVFTGQVSEVSMGDVITVVAQSYGTELQKPITDWGNRKYNSASAYKMLDNLIHRPEIMHFGFAEWSPIINNSLKSIYRRLVPQTGTYNDKLYIYYAQPSWWRSYLDVGHIIERFTNESANNIFTPQLSKIQEEFEGEGWEFQMENRTVWEMFQEMARRMPGYVTQVLPYDNRATIYFGPTDGYYSYSDEVASLVNEWRTTIEDQQGLLDSAISNGDLTPVSNDQVSSMATQVNALVNQASQAQQWTIGQGANSATQFYFNTAPTASWILQQTQIWLATQPNNTSNVQLINSFRLMAEAQGSSSGLAVGPITFTPGGSIQLFNPNAQPTSNGANANNPLYTNSDGIIVDKNTYLSNLTNYNLKVPANMKMVRGYHYYDSLRNIISNDIIATDENMWNKVDVVTPVKLNWLGAIMHPKSPNGYEIVSAKANDNIWKERVKTLVKNEPNAMTDMIAWKYALGNLKLGMNEMYSGSITILGDPTVKPNDVVFINDYYTDMNGPFEVREVNHHFSHETGFVTSIVPDLIVYPNNSIAMASDITAGGLYDDISNIILMGHNVKVPPANKITNGSMLTSSTGTSYGTPALNNAVGAATASTAKGAQANGSYSSGFFVDRKPFIRAATTTNSVNTVLNGAIAVAAMSSTVPAQITAAATKYGALYLFGATGIPFAVSNAISSMQFAVGGWSADVREPINFIPLIFSNRPYIAGIEGWRRSDWWEAGVNAMKKYIYYEFIKGPTYIGQVFDKAISGAFSGGIGAAIVR